MTAGGTVQVAGIRARLVDWLWSWSTRGSRRQQQEAAWAPFDEQAVRLGYATNGRLGAAMEIAKRCRGAEWELKRVTERLKQLQQERRLVQDMAGPPYLSPAEVERLAKLAEEAGELVRAVGKVQLHGWESTSPFTGRTNREALEREIGSVRAVVGLLLDSEDVRLGELQSWQRSKRGQLAKWMHHQVDSPTREEQLEMAREIELATRDGER